MIGKYRNIFYYTCLLLIGAGVFGRCWICWFPLEYDEIFTAVTSNPQESLRHIVRFYLLPDVHPPLHNLFLWCYNHFVPYGPEWLLRLPSVLCGVVSVWMSWKVFPKRFGSGARFIFTTLVSINFFLLFFSQQVRPYSFLFLEALLFTFLFFDFLRCFANGKPILKKYIFLYILLLVLLTWTHYFGTVFAGIISFVLLVRSLFAKRYVKIFLLVPIVVFGSFLPWLIPNLQANIDLRRFNGTWWANSIQTVQIWQNIANVFFYSEYVFICFSIFWLLGLNAGYKFYRKHHVFPYGKEIASGILLAGSILLVAVVLKEVFHISFFLSRYFIVIVPAVYYVYTLSVLPWVKRSRWSKVFFLLLCFMSLCYNLDECWYAQYTPGMRFKAFAQYYQKNAADKDLYVISFTPFPPAAMKAMYAFYLNTYLGMNINVYELFFLDYTQRTQLLSRRENAVILVHNCIESYLSLLSLGWNRSIAIGAKFSGNCVIQLSEEGAGKDPSWDTVENADEGHGRMR